MVTGAAGMVGRAVSEYCRSNGDAVVPHDHRSLESATPIALQTLCNRTSLRLLLIALLD